MCLDEVRKLVSAYGISGVLNALASLSREERVEGDTVLNAHLEKEAVLLEQVAEDINNGDL